MVNLKDKRKGVDASYNGSFFASLSWTFCKMCFIQMPQTHYKIINLKKYL